MNDRYKNYGLWISLSSFVFIIIQENGIQITPEKWDVYINSILSILILLGIINNPQTKNRGFSDDE
jgi:uncharacterized membrane protein